jgi:hypothetical protein
MKCKDILELMSPYIDEELGAYERKAIETHIDACDNCRLRLESLKTAIRAARDLGEVDVPPKVSKALRTIALTDKVDSIAVDNNINDEASGGFFSRFRSISFARYMAATGAIAVIVIVFIVSQRAADRNELAFHGNIEQQGLDENAKSTPVQEPNAEDKLTAGSKTDLQAGSVSDEAAEDVATTGAVSADKAATNNAGDNGSGGQGRTLFGSSTDNSTPAANGWTEVLASTKNYDRTSGDILLNNISKKTEGLYTVGDATQKRAETIDEIVGKISARGGNGEAIRKPLNALLDDTKRDALPVYMEKAKFKGTDCWVIVIRWGYGESNNELNKASLYVTDLTGWKTLYYQSQ